MELKQRTDDDCLKTCLSHGLDIPYEQVPDFYKIYEKKGESWIQEYDAWLLSKGYFRVTCYSGYNEVLESILMPSFSIRPEMCIALFKKKEKEHTHAVVLELREGEMVLIDPKPNTDYVLSDIVQVELIFRMDNEFSA